MLWFKVLLLILVGDSILSNIRKAGGWQPKTDPWLYALWASLLTFMFIGILLWL